MSLSTIDTNLLVLVSGGAGTTQSTEGGVTLPNGVGATVKQSSSTDEPSRYLRCLDTVQNQSSWLESHNTVEARQDRQCGWMKGAPDAQ